MTCFQKCGLLTIQMFLLGIVAATEVEKQSPPRLESHDIEKIPGISLWHHVQIEKAKITGTYHPTLKNESENKINPIPVSYINASQFRKTSDQPEKVSSRNQRLWKTASGKFIGNGGKLLKIQKQTKSEDKNKKKYDVFKTNPIPIKNSVAIKKQDTVTKTEEKYIAPYQVQPFPSDDFFSPHIQLPSNEEFDSNNRFMHSILFGYGNGF